MAQLRLFSLRLRHDCQEQQTFRCHIKFSFCNLACHENEGAAASNSQEAKFKGSTYKLQLFTFSDLGKGSTFNEQQGKQHSFFILRAH
jgi:hypothetical protein